MSRASADQGVIVEIGERRNLLYRSDQYKSKLFAANLDQLLIVLATEPHFSEDLLGPRARRGRGERAQAADRAEQDRRERRARGRAQAARALSCAGLYGVEVSIKMQPDAARDALDRTSARAFDAVARPVGHGQIDARESADSRCRSRHARDFDRAEQRPPYHRRLRGSIRCRCGGDGAR